MMHLSRTACALVLLAAPALGVAAGRTTAQPATALTPREVRLVQAAQAQVNPAIDLLERLVNINSGTMNRQGVAEVGRVMMAELAKLGFNVRWVPMDSVGRAGHVVAVHAGSGRGRKMLLIGHLDTVFDFDSPFQRFERRGDIAEGPGVNDMKDGLAIMVAALRALHETGDLRSADVRIVLSGDEENAGAPTTVSRADMIEAARHSDVALEFEALATQDGHDMGSISRRSSSSWSLRATSRSGHSSGIFSGGVGDGAVYELARILDAFRLGLREPNATYNVGLVVAGAGAALNDAETTGNATGKTNVIPAVAIARGDLRTLSNEQTERLTAKMRTIVEGHLAGTQAEISFSESYPAMPPTAGNRRLLDDLNEINAALGLEPMAELDPLRRGAGDISFVADRVDGLVGFGGAGQGSHAPGETVELSSFDRQIKRVALLIARLSGQR
jgi:glutamate carboxypeptidase